MKKYAKLINGNVEFAPQNKGSIMNYNLDEDLMLADGYKPLLEEEIPNTNRKFEFLYEENEENIIKSIRYLESEETYISRTQFEDLERSRLLIKEKIKQTDLKRIRALCEPSIKDETTGETWLEYYTKQILQYREELNNLNTLLKNN